MSANERRISSPISVPPGSTRTRNGGVSAAMHLLALNRRMNVGAPPSVASRKQRSPADVSHWSNRLTVDADEAPDLASPHAVTEQDGQRAPGTVAGQR